MLVVGWTTFAFAGLYPSLLLVPALVLGVLALAYRDWASIGARPAYDAWLAVVVAGIALQMVPLPRALVDFVSPGAHDAWQQLSLSVPSMVPLSIDAPRTRRALLATIAAFLVFLVGRQTFSSGGVRVAIRGVAYTGMLLAAIALAQAATARGLIYWRWKPVEAGADPFGPFVNRNHFTTWAILAIPMTLGYLAAHSAAHAHRSTAHMLWRRRILMMIDARAIGLTAAACLMLVALILTQSRSGLLGIAAASATALVLRARGRPSGGRTAWWIAAGILVVAGLTIAQISPAALGGRIASVRASATGRLLIWHDTMAIVRDFWLTGTGAGTYVTSMLLYQRSPGWFFNQAHNHYLQVVSEGGLLLGVPVFTALGLYFGRAWRTLMSDHSGMYWVRAGAFSGLVGVAAQCLWETGLTMPANALLAAISAAIVVHVPPPSARH